MRKRMVVNALRRMGFEVDIDTVGECDFIFGSIFEGGAHKHMYVSLFEDRIDWVSGTYTVSCPWSCWVIGEYPTIIVDSSCTEDVLILAEEGFSFAEFIDVLGTIVNA